MVFVLITQSGDRVMIITRFVVLLFAVLFSHVASSQHVSNYTEKYFKYSFDEKFFSGTELSQIHCKDLVPDTSSFFVTHQVYCESQDSGIVKVSILWKKYSYSGFEASREVLGKWIDTHKPSTTQGSLECKKSADFDGVAGLGTSGSSMYDCVFSRDGKEHYASVIYFNPEHPNKNLSQMLFVWDMTSVGEEAKKTVHEKTKKIGSAIRITK